MKEEEKERKREKVTTIKFLRNLTGCPCPITTYSDPLSSNLHLRQETCYGHLVTSFPMGMAIGVRKVYMTQSILMDWLVMDKWKEGRKNRKVLSSILRPVHTPLTQS